MLDLLGLSGRSVLLVQPHPDDVCYSLGGCVALAAPRGAMTLLTVFSRSAWALPVALRRSGVERVSQARREEDANFCQRYGLTFHALDFPDSSVIGHDEAAEMTADPADDDRTEAVAAAVRAFVERTEPDLVIGPAALGGHVDHRIVRKALAPVAAPDRPLLLYEDLPYAARLRSDALTRTLVDQGLRVRETIAIDDAIDAKLG